MPKIIMPMIGAPMRFTFENTAGNMWPSAAEFPGLRNRELPAQQRANASKHRQRHDDVTDYGIEHLSYARAKGPVEFAKSAFGTMPWITAVERM